MNDNINPGIPMPDIQVLKMSLTLFLVLNGERIDLVDPSWRHRKYIIRTS